MSPFVSPARIVVLDDAEDVLLAARLALKRHFAGVETLRVPADLIPRVKAGDVDVILLDMNFRTGADSGREGLSLLEEVLEVDPDAVVVLITAHGELELAVEAMKKGASDFVTKPWSNERLVATLIAAANLRRAKLAAREARTRHRGLIAATDSSTDMIGTSPAMREIFDLIDRTAPSEANVLILGENGTGKELVARELHRRSQRAEEAFVRVDLGTISAQLFESELFGHRRGAFTDAKEDRVGRFRAASGGTLFLDEIGNVPLHLQSKLLSALERREVVPVGSERAEAIDVRVICATNQPMSRLLDSNLFRADLLWRINTITIDLPPLRARREDIAPLVEHYVAFYNQKYNMARKPVTAAALAALTAHDWPGNVRALRHAVERAVVLSRGAALEVGDFALAAPVVAPAETAAGPLDLDTIEREAVRRALDQHRGNISRAAEALGLTRASLYRRMEKYGL
ncbi:MAG: sigma-54-dependent Fis family transcriptional regulator [Alphaproteobacteria bacterium]|nr:sigma-54-dependent Fis family transcriptional regulator [Alphaproteobacteria bacterium]